MRQPAFLIATVLLTLCLSVGLAFAQEIPPSSVTVLVNRDNVNVRLSPALGSEVIGFVNAGYTAQVEARSADNEWVRVRFSGEQGWIGLPVLTILSGDLNSAPVADPRTIPYGGFDSPRAGLTSATSPIQGRLDDSGVRLRAGPSRAYPVLAEVPRLSVFPLLGRTWDIAWYQINFEGTLGWITAAPVTIIGQFDVRTLPVDGIVAESVPISQPTAEDYLTTLRLLRSRVEFAQPSLDAIRSAWTAIAVGGRATCGHYPARPSDYNIPVPLLAAFFNTLNPLQANFNSAMANLRQVIDLLIQACTPAQPAQGSVGQGSVELALSLINQTDVQFIQLRQRLNELVPPELQPGPDECLFSFANQADVLHVIQLNRIYVDHFIERRTITGYCFDASAGQAVTLTALRLTGNVSLFIAISPFDNPTNFLATAQPTVDQGVTTAGPFVVPISGRYLVILNNIAAQGGPREGGVTGDFAVLAFSPQAGTAVDATQTLDLATGQVTTAFDVSAVVPAAAAPSPNLIVPTIIAPSVNTTPGAVGTFCPGLNLTCPQMTSQQAQACLQAGNFTLDPDGNGIACNP